MRDHPEVRPHAHPLYLPMPQQRLEAFDLAEIAARLNRLDRVLELHRRRHVADQHGARPQSRRGDLHRAPRLRQIEEHPIDAGFIEAAVKIAHLDCPVGRVAEECRHVLARRVGEILAQLVRDDASCRADRPQQRDRQRARSRAAFDHRRAGKDVAPNQQRPCVLGIDHLRRARQMRDQVGVGRPQHEERLAGRELDARSFLDSEQLVGAQLAANQQLLAGAQHLHVAAALAIYKNYRIVFFEARVQGAQRLHASGARATLRTRGLLTMRACDLTFEDAPGQMVASNGRVVLRQH